jgi:hypothetical protein|tara:strand:- start:3356 stop:4003 length:648 start_codon:yes stop_codon:yes gene_type:complete
MQDIIWPTKTDGTRYTDKIVLNRPSLLNYLDCESASPLRTTIADIIDKNNCKNIIDVGCGQGHINDLVCIDNYMGFDPDSRSVRHAKKRYAHEDNIEFRNCGWGNDSDIQVEFEVDCLMFVGVLSYAIPEYPEIFKTNGWHYDAFNRLCKLYNPKIVIIQEILQEQTHIVDSNELRTLDLHYYKQFKHKYYELDLPIWCGHRAILEIDGDSINVQ